MPRTESHSSSRGTSPTLFQPTDTEPGVLEAGGKNLDKYQNEKVREEDEVSKTSKQEPTGNASIESANNETSSHAGSSETDSEFVVWWEEPADQDPANPMNWPMSKKWLNVLSMSGISFLVPLASSMFAPGIPQVMEDFNTTSSTFATFVVSIFVLGFAFGPLLLAPLSEMFGRVIIYNVTNILFLVFTILCAVAQSPSMLLAFRFLSGFAGVATITCGSGTIADIMPREKRGLAMSIWSVGPILGPMVGPIAGGYLTEGAGWRWVFWVIAIAIGCMSLFAFVVMKETYAVTILERKAKALRKSTGNSAYRSKLASKLSNKELMRISIVRPLKMLIFCPIVTAMCSYIAIMYGLLYILFTTFTFIFEDVYGFSTSAAGLAFIGSGIGTLCGLAYVAILSDKTIKMRAAKGKTITPEDRLPLIITVPGSLALPIGFLIYGWAAEKHAHWIVAQLGTLIIGFGSIAILMSIQTYLVDAFTQYAASVIAANAVMRSLLGALLPLCGLDMYDALGWGWGNTLLGFVALAFAPLPWVFGWYGDRIRNSKRGQIKL
ncbi:major facilitator superfamily transporter [Phlyctema vagabunda]|uniref:Major facilitator superfamily transporter n=1 Tax=Phlyctema vagabunda TaxID=108571 RepID=A0ABR4PP42_9HELO